MDIEAIIHHQSEARFATSLAMRDIQLFLHPRTGDAFTPLQRKHKAKVAQLVAADSSARARRLMGLEV